MSKETIVITKEGYDLLLIFPIALILAPAYMLYKVWNEESP